MIIVKRETHIEPSALQGMVIYQWVGKTRWLPHIGSPLYIIGSRDSHVIGIPMGKSQRDTNPTYIHVRDIAIACDADREYETVDTLLHNYRSSRGRIEEEFAKMIRSLAPKAIVIEQKPIPKLNVRNRERPRSRIAA